jgi:hypothetical protein
LPIPVGAKSVLFAPPDGNGNSGEWKFIEPNASSLKFLADDVKETIQQLRELGRQPLTAQTGNLTVVTTAFAADKANSVVQAWALNLKDALENAFLITAMWLNDKTFEAEIEIDTDFDVNLQNENAPDILIKMFEDGNLSQDTLWQEMQRRNILGSNFNSNKELEKILSETPADDEVDLLEASNNIEAEKSITI